MSLELMHLDDPRVRRAMVDEFGLDVGRDDLYVGKHLSPEGEAVWPSLLQQALELRDPDWLVTNLSVSEYWLETYVQQRRTGPVQSRVPRDAITKLCYGEFARFYIRAVCIVALSDGRDVEVVRLRQVSNPRPESEALLGTRPDATALLESLRGDKGADTYLGIPGGPNSGLGIALV